MPEPETKTAPGAPPAEAPAAWHPAKRNRVAIAVTVLLVVIAVVAVMAAWRLPPFAGRTSTDNAYIRGRTTIIAPQVSGYVAEVLVRDYEVVRPGQVLARIDDRIYTARVEQARANLAAAVANLTNSTQAHASRAAGLRGQLAGIISARAQLQKSRADMARASDLASDGSISIRERDQTLAALAQAEAQLRQSLATADIGRQDVKTVDVGRGGLEAQVDAARAQLNAALIDLDHTTIRAPEGGRLGEVGVRLGQYVTNGTQLMAVVPVDRWVIANFKEAETVDVVPGQAAHFTVDALGGAAFTGHVLELAPATGSEFSVIKPDNGTGNFIKIPQRIGVRIAIDPGQRLADRLRPGMSVEVTLGAPR
jgi:multidrug resistance efflux pump